MGVNHSKPLTESVYRAVYGDIINGRITSEDILTERMLIEKLGVSKSPVREALIELCNEDILRAIPRLGYMVIQITPQEIRDLGEARISLELYLLERSFTSLTDGKIAELDALNQAHIEDAGVRSAPMDNWQRNMEFHLRLASLARNKVMYDLLEQVLRKLTRATTQHFMGYENGDLAERSSSSRHVELVRACEGSDLRHAKRILETDINALRL